MQALSPSQQCQFHYSQQHRREGQCPHRRYGTGAFCIFHEEGVTGKANDFAIAFREWLSHCEKQEQPYQCQGFVFPEITLEQQRFTQPLQLDGGQFTGDVSFNNCLFLEDTSWNAVQCFGKMSFRGSIFSKATSFFHSQFSQNAGFMETQFLANLSFREAQFQGIASFRNSRFCGVSSFREAQFHKDASFREASFENKVTFRKTIFSDKASFREATFQKECFFIENELQGNVDFKEALFQQQVLFEKSVFCKDVHFDSAKFLRHTEFLSTQFQGLLRLQHNVFYEIAELIQCQIRKLEYHSHVGETLTFNQCLGVEGAEQPAAEMEFANADCSRVHFFHMSLGGTNFLGADVRQTVFQSCDWEGTQGKTEYRQVAKHDEILQSGDVSQLKLLHSLYQQLKNNLLQQRAFRESGDFHYREMELRLRLSGQRWLGLEYFVLVLYQVVCDFGENYRRLIILLIGSIAVSAWAIAAVEQVSSYDSIFHYLSVVFFGAVPSTFQSYAHDQNLHTLSKVVIVFESIIILVLISLLVSSLFRRFRR